MGMCVVKFPGSRDLISEVYTRNSEGLKYHFVCLKTSISGLRYIIFWPLGCKIFGVKKCRFAGPKMSFDSFINVIICPVGWKILGVKRFHFTDLERTFCAPVHCAGAKKPFYSR